MEGERWSGFWVGMEEERMHEKAAVCGGRR